MTCSFYCDWPRGIICTASWPVASIVINLRGIVCVVSCILFRCLITGCVWKGTGCLYYYRVITLAKLTVRKTIRCLQVPLHQDVAAQFLEKIYSHEPGQNFTTHTFVKLISAHFENLQDNFLCARERLVNTDLRVQCEGYLFAFLHFYCS